MIRPNPPPFRLDGENPLGASILPTEAQDGERASDFSPCLSPKKCTVGTGKKGFYDQAEMDSACGLGVLGRLCSLFGWKNRERRAVSEGVWEKEKS